MMSYKELMQERLTCRSADPQRSAVLSMLLDSAYKIAKDESREPSEADILLAAKRAVKEIDGVEATVRGKVMDGSGDALLAKYAAEKTIYQSFLPKALSRGEIEQKVSEYLATVPEADRTKKLFGKHMGSLKGIEGMDGGVLSEILKRELL